MDSPYLTRMHRLRERVLLSRLPLETGADLIRTIRTLFAHGGRVAPAADLAHWVAIIVSDDVPVSAIGQKLKNH